MKKLSAFKRWYSLSEAADAINVAMDESLEVDDIVELVSTGELPAWYDARGLYAVPVAPACRLDVSPTAVLIINGHATRDHQKLGFVDFIVERAPVRVLSDYHQIVAIERFDVVSIPIDENQAMTVLAGGKIVFDDDGSMLQLVCRKQDAPSRFLDSIHFRPDHLPFDREAVLIRADDLRTAIQHASSALSASGGQQSTSGAIKPESSSTPKAQGRSENSAHQTKLLELLQEGAKQWWGSYDPDDPSTAPESKDVAAWFKNKGAGKRVAEVMAQILRADGLAPGPRRRASK